MGTALHQLLALEKGRKNMAERAKTALYHAMQRTALFEGLVQTYRPFDEGGETLPNEEKLPQLRGDELLVDFEKATAGLINLVATKDEANTRARADVIVGESTILRNVPVTTLLYLEHQLNDLKAAISKLPVLDPAYRWEVDPTSNLWRAPDEQRNRTKKMPRVLTKAEATDTHAAQVEVFYEDMAVGRYTTTRYSSALPARTVKGYMDRVEALLEAVKVAREQANTLEVEEDATYGRDIFRYLLAPVQ